MDLENFVGLVHNLPTVEHIPDSISYEAVFGNHARERDLADKIFEKMCERQSSQSARINPQLFTSQKTTFDDKIIALMSNVHTELSEFMIKKFLQKINHKDFFGVHDLIDKKEPLEEYLPLALDISKRNYQEIFYDEILETIKDREASNIFRNPKTSWFSKLTKKNNNIALDDLLDNMCHLHSENCHAMGVYPQIIDLAYFDLQFLYQADFQNREIVSMIETGLNIKNEQEEDTPFKKDIRKNLFQNLAEMRMRLNPNNGKKEIDPKIIERVDDFMKMEDWCPSTLFVSKTHYWLAASRKIGDLFDFPFAVRNYCDSLQVYHEFETSKQNNELINNALNILREKEFEDHYSKKQFVEYNEMLVANKGINKIIPIISGILTMESDRTLDLYLSTFLNQENRSIMRIAQLTSDRFSNVMLAANEHKWMEDLYDNLEYVLSNHVDNLWERLRIQKSGALVRLLENQSFKNQLNRLPTDWQYDSFETIQNKDQDLFQNLITNIQPKDNNFLSALDQLASQPNYRITRFNINEDTKSFILGLTDYTEEDSDAIHSVLSNFQDAQMARAHQLTPDFNDNLDFARWYIENHMQALEEIRIFDKATIYMAGEDKKGGLRRDLMKIIKNHGEDFCKNYLNDFRQEEFSTYTRLCSLFAQMSRAKDVCRKREEKSGLLDIAKNASKENWDNFKSEIKNCERNEYLTIINKHHVSSGDESKMLYDKAKAKNPELIEKLDSVRDDLDDEIFNKICSYVAEGHTKLATGILSKIDDISIDILTKIVQTYDSDEELYVQSLESFLEVQNPKSETQTAARTQKVSIGKIELRGIKDPSMKDPGRIFSIRKRIRGLIRRLSGTGVDGISTEYIEQTGDFLVLAEPYVLEKANMDNIHQALSSGINKIHAHEFSRLIKTMEYVKVDLKGVDPEKVIEFSQIISDLEQIQRISQANEEVLEAKVSKGSADLAHEKNRIKQEREQLEKDKKAFYEGERAELYQKLQELKKSAGEAKENKSYLKQIAKLEDELQDKEQVIKTQQGQISRLEQTKADKTLKKELEDLQDRVKNLQAELEIANQIPTDEVNPTVRKFYEKQLNSKDKIIDSQSKEITQLRNRNKEISTQAQKKHLMQYDACLETLENFAPQFIVIAELFKDQDTVYSTGDIADQIVAKKNQLRTSRLRDLEENPQEIITQVKTHLRESNIGQLYDQENLGSYTKYQELTKQKEELSAKKVELNELMQTLQTQLEALNDEDLINKTKAPMEEKITDCETELNKVTQEINRYDSERLDAITHDKKLIEEIVMLEQELQASHNTLQQVKSKLKRNTKIPVAFHLSKTDDDYYVRIVLPITQESGERMEEIEGLGKLHGSIIGQVFLGKDYQLAPWYQLVQEDSDISAKYLQWDIDSSGLMYHEITFKGDTTTNLKYVQNRISEITASLYEQWKRSGLQDYGIELEISQHKAASLTTEDQIDFSFIEFDKSYLPVLEIIQELSQTRETLRTMDIWNAYEQKANVTLQKKQRDTCVRNLKETGILTYNSGQKRGTRYTVGQETLQSMIERYKNGFNS